MSGPERIDDGAWHVTQPHVIFARGDAPLRYRGRLARFYVNREEWRWSLCPHSHPDRAAALTCGRSLVQERNTP